MITEYRRYRCAPDDAPDLEHRFRHLAAPLFAAHGFRVAGAWTPARTGTAGDFLYAVHWSDTQAMAEGWQRFRDDPAWQRGRRHPRYERLRPEITSTVWRPADFVGPAGRR
ncbi:NIPSNAP family protein [Streptomyces sp. NPDC052077]|uniref:NIPSNAP family protein n=1 Tax=Streptomyces sp. NPDC052077 TaxID=3154757 RepID=UPI00342067BD